MRQTQGACQGSLRRTCYYQRANTRCARARGALESRVHRAVIATVATPGVSIQDCTMLFKLKDSGPHGSLSLCRVGWGGFGTQAWGGTARSGRSRSERWWSRGGVTSYHRPREVTCLWGYAMEGGS